MSTKVCTHCGIEKSTTEFSRCKDTKDGLQYWCKECQAEANKERTKKIKLQKRNTKLKRLSTYHINQGLQYKFKEPQKKNSNRQVIVYRCLSCNKEVESTLDLAWEYRFNCKDCNSKGKTKPLFVTEKQLQKQENDSKVYKELNKEHTCNCYFDKKEENKTGFVQYQPDEHIKIVVVPIPQYIDKPVEEKKGLFNWFKKLFHR